MALKSTLVTLDPACTRLTGILGLLRRRLISNKCQSPGGSTISSLDKIINLKTKIMQVIPRYSLSIGKNQRRDLTVLNPEEGMDLKVLTL